MVTGSKNIQFTLLKSDPSLKADNVKNCHSVIGLSETGASALVISEDKSQTLMLASARWDQDLSLDAVLALYDDFLHELPVRIDHCESTEAVMNFGKFSLVPEHLYTQGTGETVLSYTASLKKGEHIYTDHWLSSECIILYSLAKPLSNWYSKNFAKATFRHQATAINNLYGIYDPKDTYCQLHVSANEADFFVGRGGRVLFYNKFPYDTEEDLLYYILFALEQNRVLATEIELHLSGMSLKGEKLHVLLSKYLGEVSLLPIPQKVKLSSSMSVVEMRQHITLLGVLWPE